jgi:hypothetical protein
MSSRFLLNQDTFSSVVLKVLINRIYHTCLLSESISLHRSHSLSTCTHQDTPLLWISCLTPLVWVVKFHPTLEVVLQEIETFYGLGTSTCTFKLVETLLWHLWTNTFILPWYKGIILTLEDIRILCLLTCFARDKILPPEVQGHNMSKSWRNTGVSSTPWLFCEG